MSSSSTHRLISTDFQNDPDLTRLGSFQQVQIAVDPIGAHDRHEDDAAGAEVALMQGDT